MDHDSAGPVDDTVHRGSIRRRLARRGHSFVRRHEWLRQPLGWISRKVALAPMGSPKHRLLGPLRAYLRGEMGPAEVLRIVDAFEQSELRFWLMGGWGVDALTGSQSRTHDDLDLVLDAFDSTEPAARKVLATLGYFHVASFRNDSVQMPQHSTFDDGAGHQVELVCLAWDRVAAELGLVAPAKGALPMAIVDVVSAKGNVEGRPVPCVAPDVQRVLHDEFGLRPVHHHDMAALDPSQLEDVRRPPP